MDSPLHILLLEDQPEDAALISDELRRAGLRFEAHRVESREDFVRQLHERKPDIILSDHGLPSFDGLSALTLARRTRPEVPVVFVTGAVGPEFAIKLFENGATDYVLKHNIRELAPAVKRALRRARRQQDQNEQHARMEREQELYRLLVDSVHDYALCMLDPDGRVTTWNSGAERIEGFTAEEALGRTLNDLFPKEVSASHMTQMLHAAARDGRYEEEGWRTRKTGERYWANLVLTAIRDSNGMPRGFSKVVRNLTERRNYLEALEQSELRTRAIIETALDAVILMDSDGNVHEWNPAAERMFGYKRAYALGKKMADLIVPPYLRRAHNQGLARYLSEGTAVILGQRYQTVGQRADGSEFDVELAVTEMPRTNDGPRMFTGYISDITERKRAEEQMREFSQQLEQRVTQRTEQLEAANKELEAFSYSVSHDLRAPLRHINGFVELLQASVADKLDPEDQKLLHTIADSAQHMGRLIDDLLNFSRMGRTELRVVPVKLDNVLQESMRELRQDLQRPDVRFEAEPLPTVEGDPAMLRQVFINLLANALKYSRNRKPSQVRVFAREDDIEHVIGVSDNGVGFDPAYAHKLFGVFQRLHSPQEFEGTGIGLAIVRRVVARHGGRVWAEGQVDQGATFYFALPKERPAKEQP